MQTLTAAELNKLKEIDAKSHPNFERDRHRLLKALERVQKQLVTAWVNYHLEVCEKKRSAPISMPRFWECKEIKCIANRQALCNTGGETDGIGRSQE